MNLKLLLLAVSQLTLLSCFAGKPKTPNLVFIFSDQQAFDMLGCYGNDQIITPYQLTNLFDDPGMASVKEKLWAQTREWMAGFNDQFWQKADFDKAATQVQWNNPPYIRPVDVLKRP